MDNFRCFFFSFSINNLSNFFVFNKQEQLFKFLQFISEKYLCVFYITVNYKFYHVIHYKNSFC